MRSFAAVFQPASNRKELSPMPALSRCLLVACVLVLSSPALAQNKTGAAPSAPSAPGTKLSEPYPLTTGEYAAMQLTILLLVNPPFSNAPVFAAYDRAADKLAITVLGARDSVDSAKQILEELRTKLALKDDATAILIYRNREKNIEIVRREGGKYISP
jgi:hypothetical protein